MAYYSTLDRGYGAGPRGGAGMGGYGGPAYGGGMGPYGGGMYGGGYPGGMYGGFGGGYPAGPGFGYGSGYGNSLTMPSPHAPARSSNYVPKFRPTSSFDYYGTATVPIYTSVTRVPRGRTFPRHMPMIAHQRMSAITPAPLYSSASARVSAMYDDDDYEPVVMMMPRASQKYKNSYMEDTVSSAMQDIEDDMRNLRSTATSVLNKYTPTSLSHLEPGAKTGERKSRYSFAFNKKSGSDEKADDNAPSYYKLSSASTKESPVLMPIYVARHSIYSKSLTKDPEIERKDKGEKSYKDSTIGHSAQSRRPAGVHEEYKISDSITFLSHYIRSAKRGTSAGPAFSTRESRLARRASARDRAADRKDPERVKGRVAEKIAAQEAEKAKEREERWKAIKTEVKWKHLDEPEEVDPDDWLKDLGPASGDAPVAESTDDAPAEEQPEPEADPEPVEEVKEVKKKKKKKAAKEPTPEPEPEPAADEAAPAEEAAAEEPAPEEPAAEEAAVSEA